MDKEKLKEALSEFEEFLKSDRGQYETRLNTEAFINKLKNISKEA